MTAGDTFPPGTPLQDGRFVISGLIASGGQATTYEGIDKSNGTRVAIKRFSVRGASSWKEVELAEREARVLGGLDHPALPKVISHFEEQGALYLVLEYIEGSTLEQLRTEHRLGQADVVDYLKQVADILHYIHGQSPPLVHRDIKPRNLIRRPDGRIALVDFGSVRDRLRPEGGSTVVGTFGYMAPEQFQGRATAASDTYGAAATALALLSGRDPDQLPHKGLRLDVEASLGGTTTPEIKRFLDACLDPNPDTRPASLRGALATYPIEKVVPKTTSYARSEYSDADGERGQTPFSTHGYQRNRSRKNPDGHHGTTANHDYADLGQPPFSTHGYQRDRSPKNRRERRHERREARREERREERRARRERRIQRDLDLQRPFAEVMAIPEVRRILRIPVVGLVAMILLVLLRTALWTVLGVVLPRLLHVISRFTGARLDDAAEQTTLVGTTLKDQLSQVAGQLREEPLDGEPGDAPRYRVAPPERSRFDTMADNFEKRAAEFETEISAATADWERRSRK